MNKMRLGTLGKLGTASVTGALLVGAIFLISPDLASGDRNDCSVGGKGLDAIQPSAAPAPLPDLAFSRPDGSTLTLSELAGKGVVLNFWATWCAPCVREMPELDRLAADIADDGIQVIAASMDRGGHAVIGDFLASHNIVNLAPLLDAKGAAGRSVGVQGLPTTLIIDANGREVARIRGIHTYDTPETRAYLQRCIGRS